MIIKMILMLIIIIWYYNYYKWSVLLIWAKESVTFMVTIEWLSFYSGDFCDLTFLLNAFA